MKKISARMKGVFLLMASAVCLTAALGVWYKVSASTQYEDVLVFGQEWQSASDSKRQEMFTVVVGEPLQRYQLYSVKGTIFEGLKLQDTERLLGRKAQSGVISGSGVNSPNGVVRIYFDIGSIEADPIGIVVPGFSKVDYAAFDFDAQTEVIVALRTS